MRCSVDRVTARTIMIDHALKLIVCRTLQHERLLPFPAVLCKGVSNLSTNGACLPVAVPAKGWQEDCCAAVCAPSSCPLLNL